MKKPWPFVLALFTAALSFGILKMQTAKREGEILGAMTTVVAAETDIHPGDTLTRENIMPMDVPSRFLTDKTLLATEVPQLLGQKSSRMVPKGSQLTHDDLTEYRMRLSDDVPNGHRAFTVETDSMSTQAGQLRPGDRVDVIGVFEENDGAMARTLLQNVAVLAVGGRRLDGVLDEGFTQVTLDLEPAQCEQMALCTQMAHITLTLRNPRDTETPALAGASEKGLRRD